MEDFVRVVIWIFVRDSSYLNRPRIVLMNGFLSYNLSASTIFAESGNLALT